MAFEESSGGIPATMLVGPTGYGGTPYPVFQSSNGNGGWGGDGWWIIILLLALGGWNNGGYGGFGGGMQLGMDFPWVLNGQQEIQSSLSDGFRDQMLNTSLTGISSDLGDIQTQLCGGFAGVNATINSVGSNITQQLYTNEIASLNRSFAEQTANAQGFNGVQAGLCDIRYGSAINTRDIIESQTRSTQMVLDKLCQLELDGVKGQLAQAQRDNVGLQNQLNIATMQASQLAQDTRIIDGVYNRLSQCPVDTTPVYGRQPIFSCGNTSNCGCSGNGFAN